MLECLFESVSRTPDGWRISDTPDGWRISACEIIRDYEVVNLCVAFLAIIL